MRQRPGLGGRRGGESSECGCTVVRWLLACTVPSKAECKAVPAQVRVTGAPELARTPGVGAGRE